MANNKSLGEYTRNKFIRYRGTRCALRNRIQTTIEITKSIRIEEANFSTTMSRDAETKHYETKR